MPGLNINKNQWVDIFLAGADGGKLPRAAGN
jgi:hypothetical protein